MTTLSDFLQDENPRFFRFATLHRGRKAKPYLIFTSETLAKRHPDFLKPGVHLKSWPDGTIEEDWMSCPLLDGLSQK